MSSFYSFSPYVPDITLSALTGDLENVKESHRNSTLPIDAPDYQNSTALMKASYRGYFDIVQYLVRNGASIDRENYYGYTALDYAIEGGHLDIVMYFESRGAQTLQFYKDAFLASAQYDKLDILQYAGSKRDTAKKYLDEAFILACQHNSYDIVSYYVEEVYDKEHVYPTNILSLIPSQFIDEDRDVFCYFVEKNIGLDLSQDELDDLLYYSVDYGLEKRLLALLNTDITFNVDKQNKRTGLSPLLISVNKADEITFILLEHGASTLAKAPRKQNVFMRATEASFFAWDNKNAYIDLLTYFSKESLYDVDLDGKSILVYAIKMKEFSETDHDAVLYILENAPELIHIADEQGKTPLMYAANVASHRDPDSLRLFEILLSYHNSEQFHYTDNKGKTAMDYFYKDFFSYTDSDGKTAGEHFSDETKERLIQEGYLL